MTVIPDFQDYNGRIENITPVAYRLRKKNGELVLQGAYFWQQGKDCGHDWRDIPTVIYSEED